MHPFGKISDDNGRVCGLKMGIWGYINPVKKNLDKYL